MTQLLPQEEEEEEEEAEHPIMDGAPEKNAEVGREAWKLAERLRPLPWQSKPMRAGSAFFTRLLLLPKGPTERYLPN